MLTEEDLESYTIADVVYPVPGHRSVYPENEMGKVYQQLLGNYYSPQTYSISREADLVIEKDGVEFTRADNIMKYVLNMTLCTKTCIADINSIVFQRFRW